MKKLTLILLAVVAVLLGGAAILAYRAATQIDFAGVRGAGGLAPVRTPPGFRADVFAEGLNGPRFIAFGPDGVLMVAERGAGRLVALPDEDGDGRADAAVPFAEGLDQPHSLAFHKGAWYVGLPSGIVRLADADGDGAADGAGSLVVGLPSGGSHRTRTVAFLPDGRMVVSVGSSCNVCEEEDPRRAAVLVYEDESGRGERLFATGLRNAVGLAPHPETGELWATNNGRDLMGDDVPPDTVVIVQDGDNHGWPSCHAGNIPDPDFGGPDACDGVAQPEATLQAHAAPLGMVFYEGGAFPEEYRGDLFIALHGSWNRAEPVGYSVVRLPVEDGRAAGPVEPFAEGWYEPATREAFGRPVGLAVGPDGALYVSDDKGGFIYRIRYDDRGG